MYTILFVYPTVFIPEFGGIQRVTDVLAKEFIKKGHKVLYLNLYKSVDVGSYEYPAPVYFFPEEKIDSVINRQFYKEFLSLHEVDFVINQSGNFEDSRLFIDVQNEKVKTISVIHSDPLLNYKYLSKEVLCRKNSSKIEFLKLFLRFILFFKIKRDYKNRRINQFNYLFGNTDCICLLSNKHIESIKMLYRNDKEKILKKIYVIPNPCSFIPNSDIPQKKKQLLYVGRLTKGEKRPDRLLRIWRLLYKKYRDWNLVIVGDGEQKTALEKKARKMDRIKFVGFADPISYYEESSIFCMTSNFEGFPMVLLEAMCFGVVPIAFNSFPAVTDLVIDGKTGFLVAPFSIKEYAQKIGLLMQNESTRIDISKEDFNFAKKYSVENVVKQWENLFYKLKK